jgi:hypothetical protein
VFECMKVVEEYRPVNLPARYETVPMPVGPSREG